MSCVTKGDTTICTPPYDPMVPDMVQVDLTEDIVCGTSSVILVILGLGIGWLVADKFTQYSKRF
jgi:hypothetical protein